MSKFSKKTSFIPHAFGRTEIDIFLDTMPTGVRRAWRAVDVVRYLSPERQDDSSRKNKNCSPHDKVQGDLSGLQGDMET
jgi:hypothetical protein